MSFRIVTDNGPVEEALFDGYSVAERILEGVMFRIRIEDGKVVCLGHRKMDDSYMEQFSEAQLQKWHKAIVENVEWFEGDSLMCDGTDAWLERI